MSPDEKLCSARRCESITFPESSITAKKSLVGNLVVHKQAFKVTNEI